MRKKFISAVSLILVLLMSVLCLACGSGIKDVPQKSEEAQTPVSSQELLLFNSDLQLTQEQALSRIKADYLKKNGGYKDTDKVVAIVTLPGDAVIDSYLSGDNAASRYSTVGEYAAGKAGAAQAGEISAAQNALIKKLKDRSLISGVRNSYSTIMNAVSVDTTYGMLEEIENVVGVQSVAISDTYNLPMSAPAADGGEVGSVVNNVDVYETGIFNSSSVSFTGKGTAVAILDSGFDCSHTVFRNQPEGELWLKQTDISSKLSRTNARKTTPNLELTDVWYSNKIPFVYDYADKDKDVFPHDSEHGTHVAGIIGGHDDEITGVAVDTQLVLLKVFPDVGDGAETDDILAALEDAVLLGVDAINMSLGSSCGFTREEDEYKINIVYDKIYESGISLITAASNSYSASFGGAQGNTNMVGNPDSGTVGAPSSYKASLSVASISGVASSYLVANGSEVVFFRESSSITGKENHFIDELYEQQHLGDKETKEYEYVSIPGYGKRINYSGVDVKGKIALVRRGENTFEDKALRAKNAGAIACIIYNNIEGDIAMSMGKTDHIPTVSISKEMGTRLAAPGSGTFKVSKSFQAGPFMSDFSSWGPLPDLELKPEVTAHGGNIRSSVPGGGYDNISGTSMATPNLCGVMVLIRQFLKEKFPDYTQKEIVKLANQMIMSTATIILNEEGKPYSPRKQGAGLASLYNVVNTRSYIEVEGIEKSKLELKDDPKRTGKYKMEFDVVNISDSSASYDLSLVAMTETVSTSDIEHVAEKDQILGGDYTVSVFGDGRYNNGRVTVAAGKTLKVTLEYTMSASDKAMIESLFPNGMYVEGFVKLTAVSEGDIDLNVPFLAFYGDWTKAPVFDKTYYEVETESHDDSIDDEDKLKADYFATTPYGSYFYNYIIPLGSYLYDMPAGYDYIPSTEEHIAVSDTLATIEGFSAVYGGLLRNAKTMTYTITDKLTGEVVKTYIDYNAHKAYSNGGNPIPYYEYLNWKSASMNFTNNRSYEFKMVAALDYGDGGLTTNLRNTFSFDFVFDNEAPVIKSAAYEKEYDSTLDKYRYYLTLVVYDNHYAQSITPIIFNSSSTYATLCSHPIPIYSEKGADNKVRIEITDYLDDIYYDALITNALAFMVDDYALNSNIYLCQLPGTRGDFKFTTNGEFDGNALTILSIYEDEVVDLTDYLATADDTVDADKDYLSHLTWTTSNSKIATVEKGQVRGIAAGRSTITAIERMDLKKASILINVKPRPAAEARSDEGAEADAGELADMNKPALTSKNDVTDITDVPIESLRFSYFETKFAYSRAAQKNQLGSIGSRIYLSSIGSTLGIYPGEKIKLFYDMQPWYVRDKYNCTFTSSDPTVALVEEDGTVTALRKGFATITLRVEGSNLIASLGLDIHSEFIIEDRTLIAYKGLGGKVEIPDDEGILYIGSYAFCLYDLDNSIELTEEDYDANKIPNANTSVTEVIIPKGVEEIRKYAFYNCSGLRKVTLTEDVKYIREYAFTKDAKLAEINMENVLSVGAHAFEGCEKLDNIDLGRDFSIGEYAFSGCSSLRTVDLTALRNTGRNAFAHCTSLASVTMTADTKLSRAMFVGSGLKSADIHAKISVPDFCFAQCDELTTVKIYNDLVSIGEGAFCESKKLRSFSMQKVETIYAQAFYDCESLVSFTLPDCEVTLGNFVFLDCEKLVSVSFGANTRIKSMGASVFRGTALARFELAAGQKYYAVGYEGKILLDKSGKTAVIGVIDMPDTLVMPAEYTVIGEGAFAGTDVKELYILNSSTVIEAFAFADCKQLTKVVLPGAGVASIGDRAFNGAAALTAVDNLVGVKRVGNYAFADTALESAAIAVEAEYGEGVFFQSKLKTVTIGEGANFGMGAFQNCKSLTTVNMPAGGGVHFGETCFANDTALVSIDLTKHDWNIEGECFYGCTSLKRADLARVTHIGRYAFTDCSSLATVTVPKVIEIGEGAFGKYDNYKSASVIARIALPDSLKVLGDGVFIGCEYLEAVTLPDSLEKMGDFMFAYCLRLEEVHLPDSIEKVGQYTFAGCESLTKVNLGKVRTIGDYALISTASLESVDLSSVREIGVGSFANDKALACDINAAELVSVGEYAFQNTALSSVTAPKLERIGLAAFQFNKELTEFVFSANVKSVAPLAFNGCSKLSSFYYEQYGTKQANGTINDYARLDYGVLYVRLSNGDWMLQAVPADLDVTEFKVTERTVAIDLYAANDNKHIETVVLPDSLKSIGNYAFYGCDSLKTVEFRSIAAPVLENTYDSEIALDKKAPGYALLHNQFDLFGLELCYCNFVELVGKNEPISMILPANNDITGYGSLVYQAYFGTVYDSDRSNYIAMDGNMTGFIDCAKTIARIQTITLADEAIINKSVALLAAIEQDPAGYGYGEDEWSGMVETVRAAKEELERLKVGFVPEPPGLMPVTERSPVAAIIAIVVVVGLACALIAVISVKRKEDNE